jgi:hypothetical protein
MLTIAREDVVGPVMPPSIAYEPSRVAPYVVIVEGILSERMPMEELETAYLRTFLDDRTRWPEPIYLILNEIFLEVDAFFSDATDRGAFVMDEAELRGQVERSFAGLRQLVQAATDAVSRTDAGAGSMGR